MSLKVVFMGTPEFAVPALERVHAGGHNILAVYTQPPRPAGRGRKLRPSPVHRLADRLGLPVHSPRTLKDEGEQARFTALGGDAAVVVAYGLILPPAILAAPRLGAFNLHASLLPRWRGAAPIQRAIMAGDKESGACVMRMDEGLDTGPVCACLKQPIGPAMTAGELHDILAQRGAGLLAEALDRLARQRDLACEPQDDGAATYAAKIDKAETAIDFTRPARQVANHIHGLSPWPGAWFTLPTGDGPVRIKVLRCRPAEARGRPGEVVDDNLTIACADGAVRLLQVQRQGRAAMDAQTFLRGFAVPRGTCVAGEVRPGQS